MRRRVGARVSELLLRLFVFDVFVYVADGLELLSVLVRHFDVELLLEGHDEFDEIERISAEILDERRLWRDLLGVHAELLDDDVLDLLFNRFVAHKSPKLLVLRAAGLKQWPQDWQVNELEVLSILFRLTKPHHLSACHGLHQHRFA